MAELPDPEPPARKVVERHKQAQRERLVALCRAAGASAPEVLVREVVDRLGERFDVREEPVEGVEEHMVFKLPAGLLAA